MGSYSLDEVGMLTGNCSLTNGSELNANGSELSLCAALNLSTHGPKLRGDYSLRPYSMTHLLVTSIILGTVILSTIVGNVFVIAAIILERNLHNVANYLITSLSVADLMVAALVMPLAAVNEVSTQWFLGSEVCDMWSSTDVLCCTSSILHLVAIAADRYWAVTSVDYIQNRSARRILLIIASIWVISVFISIPPLFGWKNSDQSAESTGQCMISQEIGYAVFATVGAFYLPLLVMLIIYIKIYRAVKKRIRKKHLRAMAAQGAPRPLLPPMNLNSVCMETNISASRTQETNYHSTDCNDPEFNDTEHETNGSAKPLKNDANRNIKDSLSPPTSPLLKNSQKSNSFLDITKVYLQQGKTAGSPKRRDNNMNQREKIEQKRERKAARTLGIITGTFVMCWLPFFILALVLPFCGRACVVPDLLMSIIGWLGYCNSLLNPIIYTIFNPDFRNAFRKILFGKYRNRARNQYRR